MSARRAAVDSGTNSTRLLVVDADGRELERQVVITRLGAGVDEHGHLDDDALRRTLDVIGDYRDRWVAHGVDPAHVRIAATSAVRDAADRDRYFDGVRDLTGVRAELLSGDEEARMAFLGVATGGLDLQPPVAVVDVGGGSTEVIVGDDHGRVRAAHSMQVGAVRVTERHLSSDPPSHDEVAAARRMIADELAATERVLDERAVRLDEAATLVGVAGTVTTIAALHLGLEEYVDAAVHGLRLTRDDLEPWVRRLCGMTVAERARLAVVPPGREDVIAGGALVLAELVGHADVDALVVSTADNLDGLVATIG